MENDERRFYKILVRILNDAQAEFDIIHNGGIQLSNGPERERHQAMFDSLIVCAEDLIKTIVEKYNLVHPYKCPVHCVDYSAGTEYKNFRGETEIMPMPPKGKTYYYDWLRKQKEIDENETTSA